jgi:hypothetical protein
MMGGVVDDGDGCGRSLLFVDLGMGRRQHDLARSVYVHTTVV